MKIHKDRLIAAVAGLTMLLAPAVASAADDQAGEQRGQLSRSDYKFLRDAIEGGQTEVRLGELAKQKATDPSVKSFGDRMVTDHSKANDELKSIASSKFTSCGSIDADSKKSARIVGHDNSGTEVDCEQVVFEIDSFHCPV